MGVPPREGWLIRRSGPLAGARYRIRGPILRIGRASDSDVLCEDSGVVSARHVEIHKDGDTYRIRDLDSTNGTFLNGERITDAVLEPGAVVRLGAEGSEFVFLLEELPAADRTVVLSPDALPQALPAPVPTEHEELLSDAVARARAVRRSGVGDQTVQIMREMLGTAIQRSNRKFKFAIVFLVVALAATSGYGYWKINGMKREKRGIDAQIQDIEALLERAGEGSSEAEQLADRLDRFEDQARAIQANLIYRIGVREQEEAIKREIRKLMAEFGAETYSIPPEFVDQVKRYIQQYQEADRPHMERALGAARKHINNMRTIFQEESLPPDLAYMVLVESAMDSEGTSPAGAVGLWQFTPATARGYGLKVSPGRDERLDPRKSTRAACKYIRELILDFGSGSSVMLALAAYNVGPSRVKQAVRKVVKDPIKERSFWYLYRVRALPPETRQYVPKVIAAMMIGRNPEQYGFQPPAS